MENKINFKNKVFTVLHSYRNLIIYSILLGCLIFFAIGPISLIWFFVGQLTLLLSGYLHDTKNLNHSLSGLTLASVSVLSLALLYMGTPCLSDTLKTYSFGVLSFVLFEIARKHLTKNVAQNGIQFFALGLTTALYSSRVLKTSFLDNRLGTAALIFGVIAVISAVLQFSRKLNSEFLVILSGVSSLAALLSVSLLELNLRNDFFRSEAFYSVAAGLLALFCILLLSFRKYISAKAITVVEYVILSGSLGVYVFYLFKETQS
jgi:hypothetical protein